MADDVAGGGLAAFRAAHPQYDDMSDANLANALYAKFYSDMPRADFDTKLGVGKAEESPGLLKTADNYVRAAVNGIPVVGELANKLQAATYPGGYSENLEAQHKNDAVFEKAHPIGSTVAKLAGGTAALAAAAGPLGAGELLGLTGPSLGGMAARGAVSGAVLSGGDAALRGENVIPAAGIGAVTGGAAPYIGAGVGKAVSAAREALAPAPTVAQNTRAVAGVDVPLSGGQAAGDFSRIMQEQAALRGGLGEDAQTTARAFFDKQDAALGQAKDAVRADLGGGTIAARNVQEAGEAAGQGVRNAAAASKAKYQGLYNEFGALPGDFDSVAFDKLGTSIRNKLTQGSNPVFVDELRTPYASLALKDVDENLGGALLGNQAAPRPTPTSDTFSIQDMDQARKRLVKIYGLAKKSGNAVDSDATSNIIHAFDDHVQTVLDSKLFSGDERAYPTLKAARAAYAEHAKTFRSQGAGDDAGRTVEKILGKFDGQAATPTEVANFLYGSSNIGSKGLSVRVSQRLKSILGPDSDEWSAVRQGLWSKLTEPAEGMTEWGPQKVSERILQFLNGDGAALSHVLFTPAERKTMQEFASVLKQIVPPTGSVNHSNTAPVLMKIAKGSMDGLSALGGFSLGGPIGAMLGVGANAGAKAAREALANRALARGLYGAPKAAPAKASPAVRDAITFALRAPQLALTR